MSSINICILKGNLTRDPELSYTPSGVAVTKFSLAINYKYTNKANEQKESVCYIDIVVWNKPAIACAEYLEKGQEVFVQGRLVLDEWDDANGNKRRKHKINAQKVDFGRKPKNAKKTDSTGKHLATGPVGGSEIPEEADQESKPDQDVKDEDIPF